MAEDTKNQMLALAQEGYRPLKHIRRSGDGVSEVELVYIGPCWLGHPVVRAVPGAVEIGRAHV